MALDPAGPLMLRGIEEDARLARLSDNTLPLLPDYPEL